MEVIRIVLLLALVVQSLAVVDGQPRIVSCGSAVRLRHSSSQYSLKSSAAKYASGQQVVTLDNHGDLLWQVSVDN